MSKVSVFILAYNEEKKIEATLESVTWADEIIVVDSFSTDGTVEICKRFTDKIIQVEFNGFGELRNVGVKACSNEWIFSIDSDERCTPEARDEIRRIVESPDSADAYLVPRRNLFMGRWIKRSGWYPNYRQPQLFRRGKMTFAEDDLVHEGFRLDGRLDKMQAALWQKPFEDLNEVVHKCNRYSSLSAEKLVRAGRQTGPLSTISRALWTFVRFYILRLGFIDGWPGFVIAFSNAEGTFYKYAKLGEIRREQEEEKS